MLKISKTESHCLFIQHLEIVVSIALYIYIYIYYECKL